MAKVPLIKMESRHEKTDKLHRYILHGIGKDGHYQVYRCMHPLNACGHYIKAEDAIGRDTICWRCGETCKVPAMRRGRYVKRPHCVDCVKVYKSKLPKPSSKPVDLGKLAEMTLEELMGDDDLFNPDKKKDH